MYRVVHTSCVQENFSKTSRIQIFDLYPVVGYLVVRCFLIFFGGRFGRVSRGTLLCRILIAVLQVVAKLVWYNSPVILWVAAHVAILQ